MPDPQTPDRLAEIRERHSKATDGPWWCDESDQTWRLHGVAEVMPPMADGLIPEQVVNKQILKAPKTGTPYAEYWPDEADAAFIVHAWEDVRDLLAEVADLEGRNALTESHFSSHVAESIVETDALAKRAAAAELERDARLPAEDVERFLKRERDKYVKGTLVWQRLDDVLDCFRLHMVTGTPLTEPRPEEGPSDPSTGRPPLTEAEELRAELAALRNKAETRLGELAEAERAYRKVGNRAGAARQDYAAGEIRALFGIEWKPGGGEPRD